MRDKKKYNKLKTELKEKEISYQTLADHLGITITALSNKMNGRSDFYIYEVQKIIEFADIKESDDILDIFLDKKLRKCNNLF